MAYIISNLKDDLAGMLHGTSMNKITGVDNLIYRAGRQLLLDCDPPETKRIGQIVNALYEPIVTDIMLKKVIF